MSPFLSDADYETATLSHWLDREPELNEVTVTVRSGGEVCRFVMLRPGKPKAEISPHHLREALPRD